MEKPVNNPDTRLYKAPSAKELREFIESDLWAHVCSRLELQQQLLMQEIVALVDSDELEKAANDGRLVRLRAELRALRALPTTVTLTLDETVRREQREIKERQHEHTEHMDRSTQPDDACGARDDAAPCDWAII